LIDECAPKAFIFDYTHKYNIFLTSWSYTEKEIKVAGKAKVGDGRILKSKLSAFRNEKEIKIPQKDGGKLWGRKCGCNGTKVSKCGYLRL
jgi:hypothetical protein